MVLAFRSTGGGGYPRTGSAYGQFNAWSKTFEIREFMGIELAASLHEGTNYRVTLFVSLQDSVKYATRNVGVHLSDQPHPQNLSALLSLEPQVRYEGETFLDDKLGWMEVSGMFTAQGGERYLAIGNFDDDANTDTISVPDGGTLVNHPEGYWDVAGYFIDDVSVVPDSITGINDELGIRNEEWKLFPNPATENLTIDTRNWQGRELMLFDATGRVVLHQPLRSSRSKMNIGQLTRGVYVVSLISEGAVVARRKLVLQ